MKWVFVGAALRQAWKKPLLVLNGWWQSLMGLVTALQSETRSLPLDIVHLGGGNPGPLPEVSATATPGCEPTHSKSAA